MSSQISKITINNSFYPATLKKIKKPPKVLYFKGNINLLKEGFFRIAIVGTRRCTPYGKQAVIEFTKTLADAGLVIVSGFAKGIDTLAHKTAIETGGKTIAVLGSGISKHLLYPRENLPLFEKIINNDGIIISEYPPDSPPLQYHFPERNRIIAGLSLGVLVIEAGEKSGALITADFAINQNKPIFVIPGSIYNEKSMGCNYLIKKGTFLVTNPQEILNYFKISYNRKIDSAKNLSTEEKKIIEVLGKEASHIDKIIRESKMSPSIVIATLSKLESSGYVKNIGGNMFIINKYASK